MRRKFTFKTNVEITSRLEFLELEKICDDKLELAKHCYNRRYGCKSLKYAKGLECEDAYFIMMSYFIHDLGKVRNYASLIYGELYYEAQYILASSYAKNGKYEKCMDICKKIINVGKNDESVNYSAIHWILDSNFNELKMSKELEKMWIMINGDILSKNERGETLLDYTVRKKNLNNMSKKLIDLGLNIFTLNNYNRSPYLDIIYWNNVDLLNYVIEIPEYVEISIKIKNHEKKSELQNQCFKKHKF